MYIVWKLYCKDKFKYWRPKKIHSEIRVDFTYLDKKTTGKAGGMDGLKCQRTGFTKKLQIDRVEEATDYKIKMEDIRMKNKANDTYSLSHTSWKCQYHIVFAPKYRRKAIYGELKKEIGAILRELCERKHVNIIEAHAMPDHIHMLVEIPPNQRVSDFMGYLKGKSTLIIFERFSNLKYRYGNRHFWCRGYYVSTVGGNKEGIARYIRDQEKEDMMYDQLTIKEYTDPFKK